MFVIFHFLLLIFSNILTKVSDWSADNKARQNYNHEYGVYYNKDGKMVDINTGKIVIFVRDKNQDNIITNCLDIRRNISEEKRWRDFSDRRQNHHPLVTVMEWNCYNLHSDENVPGVRYRDFKTGELMVVRKIDDNIFYMSVNSLKIIRKSDGQIYHDNTNRDTNYLNEEQTQKIIDSNGEGYYCGTIMRDIYNYQTEINLQKSNERRR